MSHREANQESMRRPDDPVRWPGWEWFVLLVGLPVGVLLLVIQPPGMSRDEAAHLLRVDQIAHGDLVAPLDAAHHAMVHPDPCVGLTARALTIAELQRRWRPSEQPLHQRCRPVPPVDISHTALNSPISYLPAIVGYALARKVTGAAVGGLWGARIVDLLAYLGLAWVAVRLAPVGKPFLFFVAVLPAALTLAVAVSSDPFPGALGLLAVALVIRLRVEPSDTDRHPVAPATALVALAAVLIVLANAKNLYAGASLLTLLVPAGRFASLRRRLGYVAGVVGVAVATAGSWAALVVNRIDVHLSPINSSRQAALWVRHHPWGFVQTIGRSILVRPRLLNHTVPGTIGFYYRGVHSPTVPIAVFVPAAAILGFAWWLDHPRRPLPDASGVARGARLDRLAPPVVVGTVWSIALLLVLYGELITFTAYRPDGQVVITFIEGRFFLPTLPMALLVVPGATWLRGHAAALRSRLVVVIGAVALAAWSVFHILDLYR